MQSAILASPRGGRWRVSIPERRIERMRGLLGRRLMSDEALLLPRCRSIHTIGMRFAIRAAFLGPDLTVLVVHDVPPGRPLVGHPRARHVIELPAGADVRPGDRFLPASLGDREAASGTADILSRLHPR